MKPSATLWRACLAEHCHYRHNKKDGEFSRGKGWKDCEAKLSATLWHACLAELSEISVKISGDVLQVESVLVQAHPCSFNTTTS